MTGMRIVLPLLFSLIGLVASAQNVTVRAGFVADSIVIGDEVPFYLTATYSQNLNILFPDSTYAFLPFEYQRKKFFATRTADSVSYDSAVYYLSTFEVDTIQYLQLPAFVLHSTDCTIVYSTIDSIRLKELVTFPLPDTLKAENLPLLSDTHYRAVDWLLNYPVLLYGGGGLLVLLVAGWLIFGKRIRRHFIVKRLLKQHDSFNQSFNSYLQQIQQGFSATVAENTLGLWKKYMELLDTKPYTRLTTKETALLLNDTSLSEPLRTVDAAVYGHNTDVLQPLQQLREHAEKTFQQKLEQVTHG
jgi:hypothetical protein